ncbi:MAG: DUF4924 family protein [Tannerellaceae bacterium]|jgi:hypothetical protein|nr:DUF4924 family protein [Tannerellaceae bacterium]
MIIAEKKRKENIVEWLLYMWQIEDLIRANHFDMDTIRRRVIARYACSREEENRIGHWYESLIEKMQKEGVEEKGHLPEHEAVLDNLTALHQHLMASPQETLYHATYYKILPHIVHLRAKSGGTTMPEIETCLTALYGYLMLKIQQKEVSAETQEALKQLASFLSILAEKYENNLSNRS